MEISPHQMVCAHPEGVTDLVTNRRYTRVGNRDSGSEGKPIAKIPTLEAFCF